LGLALELVAGGNPFDAATRALQVTLLWRGRPVANHQITVISEDGETVRRHRVMTDATGRASIALVSGRSYLLNAVRLEPADKPPVVWQSHWASLTFAAARG